jgi:hypothetical protein
MACGLAFSIQQLEVSTDVWALLTPDVVKTVLDSYLPDSGYAINYSRIAAAYSHGGGRQLNDSTVWISLSNGMTVGVLPDGRIQVTGARGSDEACAALQQAITALLMGTADRMLALQVQQILQEFGMVELDQANVLGADNVIRQGYEVVLTV